MFTSHASTITEVRDFSRAHSLELVHLTPDDEVADDDPFCPVTDVSPLSNVSILNLSWCSDLTDLSPPSSVWRGAIASRSPLRNVHSINLRECIGVTDVSPLAHCH